MARYKPYERYKDSGVEWIGEIPEHWEVISTKRIFKVINGATPDTNEPIYWDGDIPWVTPIDLNENQGHIIESTKRTLTPAGYNSCGTTLVPAGSIILSTRAPIGHLALAGRPLCTNQGCKSLSKISNNDTNYFYYHYLASVDELQALGMGTTFLELSNQALGSFKVCLPSLEEQRSIAQFINHKTSEIDNLIADKEKLIALLQEYRQAVISEAVTKGLDPNVKMKDSGIEWIGEIPEHWEVKPNISLFSERVQRKGDLHLDLLAVTQSRGIILQEEITDRKDISSLDKSNYKIVRRNDLAYNKMRMWQGAVGWSSYDGIVSPAYVVLKPVNSVNSKYFYYLFKSPQLIHAFKLYSYGICDDQNSLRYQDFKRIYSCVPPLIEQQAIVDYLDQKTSEIDSLISGIQDSIEQLKAYRQSLISEAVTGKIDVREFAAEGGAASGQDA